MRFERHVRRERRGGVAALAGRTLALGILVALVAAASPAAAFPAATSPAQLLPLCGDHPVAASAVAEPPQAAIPNGFLSGEAAFAMSAANVQASGSPIPFGGGYYWTGTWLYVDGWVTNDTAAAVGPVWLQIEVETAEGVAVTSTEIAAAAYHLPTGESASFKYAFNLPAYAGTSMVVRVATNATQPATYPDTVALTLVDRVVTTDATAMRTYTCTYRNDSAGWVRGPILGGLEYLSTSEVCGSLQAFQDTLIPPGGTVEMVAYGTMLLVTPAGAETYCQALPVPAPGHEPVYRFFNVRSGSHFYTASAEERDTVIAQWPGVFRYEGVAYYTNPANNTQPLYRFFYRRGGSHFYTASPAEATMVMTKWPTIFSYDGPTYSVSPVEVANSLAVYRFVNRQNSSHFYTADIQERDAVIARYSSTYIYEGPAFWVGQ